MKLEKLNDNKIRITLNSEDLKENDIDFHTFMSNPIESQELFFSVLDRAEKELGFVTDESKAIYCFSSFDEFCSFCNFLNNNILKNINNFVSSISLYEYNKKYYLVLTDLHMNANLLKSFCSSITEFANFVDHANLFETKLLEYGILIMKDNAIDIALSHFC